LLKDAHGLNLNLSDKGRYRHERKQCKCTFSQDMVRSGEVVPVADKPYHIHFMKRSKRCTEVLSDGTYRNRRSTESNSMRLPTFGFRMKQGTVLSNGLKPQGPVLQGTNEHGWMGVKEFKRIMRLEGIRSVSTSALPPLLKMVENQTAKVFLHALTIAKNRASIRRHKKITIRSEDIIYASQLIGRPILRSDLFLNRKRKAPDSENSRDKTQTKLRKTQTTSRSSRSDTAESDGEEDDDDHDSEDSGGDDPYTEQDAREHELSEGDESDSESMDTESLIVPSDKNESTASFYKARTPLTVVHENDEEEEEEKEEHPKILVGSYDDSVEEIDKL
jgi:histone H3/H4